MQLQRDAYYLTVYWRIIYNFFSIVHVLQTWQRQLKIISQRRTTLPYDNLFNAVCRNEAKIFRSCWFSTANVINFFNIFSPQKTCVPVNHMIRRFNHFYSTSRQASYKNIHWFHFTNHYKGLYLCDKLVSIITCKLCADFATETELLICRHEFAWI